MSTITFQQPVIHIPNFKEYYIDANSLRTKIKALGATIPFDMLDSWYYYTDLEGWSKILPDLVFKSSLYRKDRFDCEDYALKTMVTCRERYGLNTMGVVIGNMPQGRHGFNMFYFGDGFMLFEPNEGYVWSGAFEIGDYGYSPEEILI